MKRMLVVLFVGLGLFVKSSLSQDYDCQILVGDESKVNDQTIVFASERVTFPSIITSTNGNFVIAWSEFIFGDDEGNGVYFQLFDKNGNRLNDPQKISSSNYFCYQTIVVYNRIDDEYVFVWTQEGHNGLNVFVQKVDNNGIEKGNKIFVNPEEAGDYNYYAPDIDVAFSPNGNIAICWSFDGFNEYREVHARVFNRLGDYLDDIIQIRCEVSEYAFEPRIVNGGNDFSVFWRSIDRIDRREKFFVRKIYPSLIDNEKPVFIIEENKTAYLLDVLAKSDGNYILIWGQGVGNPNTTGVCFFQRLNSELVRIGEPIEIFGGKIWVSADINANGEFIICGQDQYSPYNITCKVFNAEGSLMAEEVQLFTNIEDQLSRRQPKVALNRDFFVVADIHHWWDGLLPDTSYVDIFFTISRALCVGQCENRKLDGSELGIDCGGNCGNGCGQLRIFDTATNQWKATKYLADEFDATNPTAVIVHGWNWSCVADFNQVSWTIDLAKALNKQLKDNSGVNILAWEWLYRARNTNGVCKFDLSKVPFREVSGQAKLLAISLQDLLDKKSYNTSLPIQLFGHSLGAHVSVQVGEILLQNMPRYSLQQITCFDSPTLTGYSICDHVINIRNLDRNVYTELYDGTTNAGSHDFSLLLDVPYDFFKDWVGHSVYEWYTETANDWNFESDSIRIYDPIKIMDPLAQIDPIAKAKARVPGTIGFGTSCLLKSMKRRPEFTCDSNESMLFDYRWGSAGHEFTQRRSCTPYWCSQNNVTIVPGDNFISTPKIIIIGEDNGSIFVDNKLELKTKPNAKVEWQFQFDSYFTGSDFFRFEQYWYKDPQAGGGGEVVEPPFAELIVIVTSGDKTLVVYDSNTDSQPIGEIVTSAYIDMREFHGLPVTIAFALTNSDATISAVVQNIATYQWDGRNNQAPTAFAGDDISQIADKDGAVMIQLSSTGSVDPEGTELQYQWVEIIDGNEFAFSNEANPVVRFSEGMHQIHLCVYDEYFAQACDEIIVVILPYTADFIRGDSNRDSKVDISDAINTLGFLFTGIGEVTCEDAADADDDGKIDISDAIATLTFLFIGGIEIPQPYPNIGKDTTQDVLGCMK